MAENRFLTLSDIQERRKTLRRDFDAAMADLDVAERVIRAVGSPEMPSFEEELHQTLMAGTASHPPIKYMILRAIHDSVGLTSREVLEAIRQKIPDYQIHNVTPKLSFFKLHDLLDLKNGLWKITDLGEKELEKSKS